jgi:drug/metabolite transporter (DMT)-like permease
VLKQYLEQNRKKVESPDSINGDSPQDPNVYAPGMAPGYSSSGFSVTVSASPQRNFEIRPSMLEDPAGVAAYLREQMGGQKCVVALTTDLHPESLVEDDMSEKANKRNSVFDLSELPPSKTLLSVLLPLFFVFFVSQTLAFEYMTKHGLPFRGAYDSRKPDAKELIDELHSTFWKDRATPHTTYFSFLQELPNYLGMLFLIALPCRKRLSDLTSRQWMYLVGIAVMDLVNQIMAKTALSMTSSAYYTVLNSMSIVFIAIFSKIFLKYRFHWGQLVGIAILLIGIVVYSVHKWEWSSDTGGDAENAAASKHHTLEVVLGSGLILAAALMDGIIFVSVESLMDSNNVEGKAAIPGPLLTGFFGLCNTTLLLIWQAAYTVTRWEDIFTLPVEYLQTVPSYEHVMTKYAPSGDANGIAWGEKKMSTTDLVAHLDEVRDEDLYFGDVRRIMWCLLFICFASIFARGSTMYMLKHLGALTFVVLKLLKMGTIGVTTHLLGWKSLCWWSGSGSLIVIVGVGVYSWYKIKMKKIIEAEKLAVIPGHSADERTSLLDTKIYSGTDSSVRAKGVSREKTCRSQTDRFRDHGTEHKQSTEITERSTNSPQERKKAAEQQTVPQTEQHSVRTEDLSADSV